jgi:hypothetical protein
VVTGETLLPMMQSMSFSGITGPYIFDSNFDRIQGLDLINYPFSNGTFQRLAYYDTASGAFISYNNAPAPVYTVGATAIARDGISVLDGDSLTPDEDGAILVLAFLVGGISSWCALILVEQIMYAAEKQQRWWSWALACAITQGGPGIWALHMIGMCAMSWSAPVKVVYHPGYAIAGLVIAIAGSWIAFQFAMYGFNRNKALQESSSTTSNQVAPVATGQKAAAAAAAAATTKQQKYEHEKTSTASEEIQDGSTGTSSAAKKRRLIRELSLDRSILGQLRVLPYRVNLWFIISGVVLSLANTGSHSFVVEALPNALGAHVTPTLSSLTLVIGSPLFTFALLVTYYFFPQANVRFTGMIPTAFLPCPLPKPSL